MARGQRQMMWSLIAGMLLLVTWFAPGGAQADGPSYGNGPRGPWGSGGSMLGVPLHSLNLTPDQWTQVKSILSSSRSTNRSIIQALRQAQSDLGDQLLASPSANVATQLALINGYRSQLLANSTATTAQVLAVLTPDQLTKAAQTRSQLKQLRTQMRQLLAPSSQP